MKIDDVESLSAPHLAILPAVDAALKVTVATLRAVHLRCWSTFVAALASIDNPPPSWWAQARERSVLERGLDSQSNAAELRPGGEASRSSDLRGKRRDPRSPAARTPCPLTRGRALRER